MSARIFSKPYATREELERARAHHQWLTAHARPLRLPPIVTIRLWQIEFGHIDGRYARVADVPVVATVLGQAHALAWASDLRQAQLISPHLLSDDHELADFVSPRVMALRRRRESGLITEEQAAAVQPLLEPHPATPVAFYKDTNPRNVLMPARGEPIMVDFDDLTLAPFGYDLAKLLVALAMTHGPLPPETYTTALACYNRPLIEAGLPPVALGQFFRYADLHHLLTLPYLGLGGYRFPWPTVHPALEDLA